jgi:hypothetical protein
MEMIYDVVKEGDSYKIRSTVQGPKGGISTIMPFKFKEHYDAMVFVYKYCDQKGFDIQIEKQLEQLNDEQQGEGNVNSN